MNRGRRRRTRRAFLAGVSGATAVGLAGCLGANRPEGVVLDPPEDQERLEDADVGFPIYGDQVPEAEVPAPRHDRTITTTEFVGERHVMLTFVFTRCPDACPLLVENLVHVYADAMENGYAERMAFMPTTFDPTYDTPEVIESYNEERGVDDADEWYFLRPDSEEHAREVVEETFGVHYVRTDDEDDIDMEFLHDNLIVLANEDGYVERSYFGEPPNPAEVLSDVEALRERW